MSFIIAFCIIGISTSLVLGMQFYTQRKEKKPANIFLGLFFLLIAIRLGKLLIQTFAPTLLQNGYFNLMHASYVALGPIIFLYIKSFYTPIQIHEKAQWGHFIPSFFLLLAAFPLRYTLGESLWMVIYWLLQIHPFIYILKALHLLRKKQTPSSLSKNQNIWLYSLVTMVFLIAVMNILAYSLHFPFYFVTSLLLILTAYLIIFLAFQGKINLLLGKSNQKYQNLKVSAQQTHEIWRKTKQALREQELYLKENLKIADCNVLR